MGSRSGVDRDGTVREFTHSGMETPVPWIWSDDLAHTLVRAGLADREQVSGLIRRPRAVAVDGGQPLDALEAFSDDDDDGEQRRVA